MDVAEGELVALQRHDVHERGAGALAHDVADLGGEGGVGLRHAAAVAHADDRLRHRVIRERVVSRVYDAQPCDGHVRDFAHGPSHLNDGIVVTLPHGRVPDGNIARVQLESIVVDVVEDILHDRAWRVHSIGPYVGTTKLPRPHFGAVRLEPPSPDLLVVRDVHGPGAEAKEIHAVEGRRRAGRAAQQQRLPRRNVVVPPHAQAVLVALDAAPVGQRVRLVHVLLSRQHAMPRRGELRDLGRELNRAFEKRAAVEMDPVRRRVEEDAALTLRLQPVDAGGKVEHRSRAPVTLPDRSRPHHLAHRCRRRQRLGGQERAGEDEQRVGRLDPYHAAAAFDVAVAVRAVRVQVRGELDRELQAAQSLRGPRHADQHAAVGAFARPEAQRQWAHDDGGGRAEDRPVPGENLDVHVDRVLELRPGHADAERLLDRDAVAVHVAGAAVERAAVGRVGRAEDRPVAVARDGLVRKGVRELPCASAPDQHEVAPRLPHVLVRHGQVGVQLGATVPPRAEVRPAVRLVGGERSAGGPEHKHREEDHPDRHRPQGG